MAPPAYRSPVVRLTEIVGPRHVIPWLEWSRLGPHGCEISDNWGEWEYRVGQICDVPDCPVSANVQTRKGD